MKGFHQNWFLHKSHKPLCPYVFQDSDSEGSGDSEIDLDDDDDDDDDDSEGGGMMQGVGGQRGRAQPVQQDDEDSDF